MTLEQQLRAAVEAAKALTDRAAAEDRDLTEQEEQQVEAHLADAERIKGEIAARDERRLRQAGLAERVAGLGSGLPTGRRTAANPIGAGPVREGWRDDPARGFKTPRAFFGAVLALGRRQPVASDVRARLMSLVPPDLRGAAGADEHSTISDSHGGFLVPETLVTGARTVGHDMDPTVGLVQRVPMATPVVKIPARVDKNHATSVSGGLTVSRRVETQAPAASRMSLELVTLMAESLGGVSYATEELLRDSPESIAALLERGFRDEFGAKGLEEKLTSGNVSGVQSVAASGAKIAVAKEAGQVAATIVYANIAKMRARIWGYGSAVWLANHDCLPELMSITAPGGTTPLFTQDAQGVERLFGRPIFFTEFCEALGTEGDIQLINWAEYLYGEYQPIEGASSIHVRFNELEQAFRFWKRDAGACWWRSVLTPKKGSTLSPVVRLATRA